MNPTPQCPLCHAAIPPQAADGLCPRCLLIRGVLSTAHGGSDSNFGVVEQIKETMEERLGETRNYGAVPNNIFDILLTTKPGAG